MGSCLRWVALLLTIASSSTPESARLVFDLHSRPKPGKVATGGVGVQEYRRLALKGLRGHHATDETHACTLQNYGDIQYHMLVEIGDPCKASEERQIFRVVPDTGSSDLWVPAFNCSHCSGRRFDQKRSCSARPLGARVDFRYGDGTRATGVALEDTVRIGDLKVEHQFLIQIDDMDATSLQESDGILGLAHHYDDDHKGPAEGHTFMSTLFKQHPHMEHRFSFLLTGMSQSPSKIIFGDPDVRTYAKEDFAYGKAYYMSTTDLWLTSVYSIGFSKTGIERVFPNAEVLGAPALVDSGSSLIVLMPDIWDSLIQELSNHLVNCRIYDTDGSVATCNCPEDFQSVPSLVINIIDSDDLEHPLCMAADEYIIRSVDPVTGNSTCVPSIQRGNSRQPVPLIFGMTFMRTFYTTFDLKNHKIGFARSSLSSLPGNMDCSVHNKQEGQFWLMTVAFVTAVLTFVTYLCCCGDVGGCCGWPSCEASKPCYNYKNLEASIELQVPQNGSSAPPATGASGEQFGPGSKQPALGEQGSRAEAAASSTEQGSAPPPESRGHE